MNTPPSQVSSHNSYVALHVKQNNYEEDDGSSGLETLLRLSQPMAFIKTVSTKMKKKMGGGGVTVIGDSLLKGAEGPINGPTK